MESNLQNATLTYLLDMHSESKVGSVMCPGSYFLFNHLSERQEVGISLVKLMMPNQFIGMPPTKVNNIIIQGHQLLNTIFFYIRTSVYFYVA